MVIDMKNIKILLAAFVIALLTTSCDESDNTANLSLSITDAPVDHAVSVIVEFTGVELKPSGGSAISFDFDEARQIDLLVLQGGDAATLLDQVEVSAGEYQWIRLKVNALQDTMDSVINFDDGSSYSLYVPSGSQRGLQLNTGFVVAQGSHAAFTIDFNLRKSVVNPTGQVDNYFLKPSLRLVDNNEVGTINGTVANSIADDPACEAGVVVYVYQGADAVVDDEGSANSPLTSANVNYDNVSDSFVYTVAYLSPDDYTLAITCEASNDLVESDEDINFIASSSAAVIADQATEVNFD
jgi:hypothetical protein